MTIHFHCECGQKLKASSESIGKSFNCPVCHESVTVPPEDETAALATNGSSLHAVQAVGPAAETDRQKTAEPPIEKSGISSSSNHAANNGDLKESDTKEFATGDTKEFESPRVPTPEKPPKKPKPVPHVEAKRTSSHEESRKTTDTGYERLNPIYERVHAASPHQELSARNEHVEGDSGSSADTARDLYRLVRKMKKEVKAEAVAKPKKKRAASGEEETDFGALFVELARTVLPGIAGVALVCFLAYWLSSTVMSAGRGLPELGDVEGTIRLDGKPLAGATVTFIPVSEDDETAPRISSSVGMTDEAGHYELMYVQDVAGAAVGTHQVMINLPLPNGAEKLPRRYNSSTELSFVVEPGRNTADFKLETKK